MKSLCIIVPCALMITSGLINLSHSYPTPNMEDKVGRSVARNVEGDGSEAKAVIANINSDYNTDPSSRRLQHLNINQKPKGSKSNKSFKSLASIEEEKPIRIEKGKETNDQKLELSLEELEEINQQIWAEINTLQKPEKADQDEYQSSMKKASSLVGKLLDMVDKDALERLHKEYETQMLKQVQSLKIKDPDIDPELFKDAFSRGMQMFGINFPERLEKAKEKTSEPKHLPSSSNLSEKKEV
ncbi:hypothetical protein DFH28DRAFT_234464 [Melampsora americana]|nr:hypothetical protein DFH28DRAFT_234464 [Melampsora americana]